MRQMHETHTCGEVMSKMERWIAEHRQDPRRSRLRRIAPTVGNFFTPLRLVDAFREYDAFFHLSRRRYIPPNFAELRHVLNIAQVHASAEGLRLITFDADGTLYADGAHMEQDCEMIRLMVGLMRMGVHVAIVTAAGYPGDASKFEGRIEGLLSAFRRLKLPPEVVGRFHLMGGECNYLLRVDPATCRLGFVADEEWQTPEMRAWQDADIAATLDEAQRLLTESASRLMMPVQVIRKTRSVGVVPLGPTIYEVLEDLAITLQQNLIAPLPFCAFNGGNDVFVDVGNKSIGLDALMRHLGASPAEVVHVGDRFTDSGNDSATRDNCSIVWVANPEETSFFIKMLLADIRARRLQRSYIE
ncbi:MAG: IMP-specific 5-nucleotidase [Monoraphidium minutum]|nr:MAG: IMP-specific 5-nucleotidase [Monoraphidium minutum]